MAAISSAEEGVSGSGDLWRVRFDVAEDAAPDTYNVVVAVGEVANVDLSDIAVESGNGKIEVREKDVPVQTMYIYSSVSYPSAGGAYEGEKISVSFRTYNACGLAAAEFEIGYDDSRLTLEEVALGSALVSAEGAISDINDDVDGYIKIAYACTRGISGAADPLVICRFIVSGNEAGSVPVTFAPGGLYDGGRNPVRADAVQANAETLYREPVIDPPDISVESRENVCGEFRVDVLAEGGIGACRRRDSRGVRPRRAGMRRHRGRDGQTRLRHGPGEVFFSQCGRHFGRHRIGDARFPPARFVRFDSADRQRAKARGFGV